MRTIRIMLMVCVFMVALFSGHLLAAEKMQGSLQSTGRISASNFIGKAVTSQQGEKIGTVKDLLFDEDGHVQYVVLSRETQGMGGELVQVPWEAASLRFQGDRLTSSLDSQKIQNAPGIIGDNCASVSESGYEDEVHSYYGPQENYRVLKDLGSGLIENIPDLD